MEGDTAQQHKAHRPSKKKGKERQHSGFNEKVRIYEPNLHIHLTEVHTYFLCRHSRPNLDEEQTDKVGGRSNGIRNVFMYLSSTELPMINPHQSSSLLSVLRASESPHYSSRSFVATPNNLSHTYRVPLRSLQGRINALHSLSATTT